MPSAWCCDVIAELDDDVSESLNEMNSCFSVAFEKGC